MRPRWMNSIRLGLRRAGFDVVRYEPRRTFPAQRAKLMAHHGIDVALDVGANIGQWADGMRADGFRHRIVSFEPQQAAFVQLSAKAANDPFWEAHHFGLGAAAGEATINVAANSQSSSVLPMLDRHLASAPESGYVGTEIIQVRTLDEVFDDAVADARRPFLKLDVQGYEREVLDGATRSLPRVMGLQVESSLVGLYDGEDLFPKMLARLDSLGFVLAALSPNFVDDSTGQTLSIDALLYRPV